MAPEKIFVNVFSSFRYYHYLEKDVALNLRKIKFPLHKEALCQVWLKLVQFRQHSFFAISKSSLLGKGRDLSFEFILPNYWLKLAQWLWRSSRTF